MVTSLRLEHHGRGRRFLEIELDDMNLSRAWGAIDRPASGRRIETFDTRSVARLAFERQATRAEQKGYWPGRHHLGLIQAIEKHPDDEAGYLVYGDWLLERGDPRGDLINAAPGPIPDALLEHRHQFTAQSWDGWVDLDWWCGFARGMCFRVYDSPWSVRAFPGMIRRVLAHPSCRFLRVLAIHHEFESSRNRWWDLENSPFKTYWGQVFEMVPPSVLRIGITPGPLLNFANERLSGPRVDELDDRGSSWIAGAVRGLPGP